MLRQPFRTCSPLRQLGRRAYAVQAPGGPRLQVFDRQHKWLQKERAASNVEESRRVDYLRDEIAARLCERLLVSAACLPDRHEYQLTAQDINRQFDSVLDFGANACNIARALTNRPKDDAYDVPLPEDTPPLATRIGHLTSVDSAPTLLHRDEDLPFNSQINLTREVLQDEEQVPYQTEAFDAVLSSLSLHWINDLPSVLRQINNVLKPDAPLIAAMFGGDSLFELRTSLQLADLERWGGVTTHTSPLADVRDMGGLLQSAGFKLLTIDVDDIVVDYPSIFELMQDLQAMGESNAVIGREEKPLSKDVLLSSDAIYKALHGNEDGESIPATYRMIYLIAWKEGPNQQQPEKRGTGQANLKDILGGGGGIGPAGPQ